MVQCIIKYRYKNFAGHSYALQCVILKVVLILKALIFPFASIS
jgi:hypothetical protein